MTYNYEYKLYLIYTNHYDIYIYSFHFKNIVICGKKRGFKQNCLLLTMSNLILSHDLNNNKMANKCQYSNTTIYVQKGRIKFP